MGHVHINLMSYVRALFFASILAIPLPVGETHDGRSYARACHLPTGVRERIGADVMAMHSHSHRT